MCSCKNETKKEEYSGPQVVKTNEELKGFVIDTINLSNPSKWKSKNIRTDSINQVDGISVLSRIETNNSSYIMTNVTSMVKEGNYRVTLVAKRNSNSFLGLRITGIYPNRADAIFNLEQGKVLGTSSIGDFWDEKATIEIIDDNWYKCILTSEVISDKIGILFGPTISESRVTHWESGITIDNDVTININSVLLEEISF